MPTKQKRLIWILSGAFLMVILIWMEMAVGIFGSPIAGS